MKVLIALMIFGLIGCVRPTIKNASYKKCIVTNVVYYGIGQKHTLQTDPEWKITTNCNVRYTAHHEVNVGDTILVKTIRYK